MAKLTVGDGGSRTAPASAATRERAFSIVKSAAPPSAPPSDAAIRERAFSLVNEGLYTVELQRRRLRSEEPEDAEFVMRWWADLQFFIVALSRMRRGAMLAQRAPSVKDAVTQAIAEFDTAVPHLRVMRNVGEHVDDYGQDSPKRRHRHVDRRALAVGAWDGTVFEWLDGELNVDDAYKAAGNLYAKLRRILKGRGGAAPSK